MTDWKRIERVAGRNSRWPNRWCYCFGAISNMETEWLRAFTIEAEDRGFEIVSGSDPGGSNIYVLGPIGS